MPYFAEKCKLKRRFKAKNQRDFFELGRPSAQLYFCLILKKSNRRIFLPTF